MTGRQLEGIVEELKRLRRRGVKRVNVSEQSVRELRRLVPAESSAETSVDGDVGAQLPDTAAGLPDLPAAGAAEEGARKPGRRPAPAPASLPEPPNVVLPEGDKRARWEALRERVLECPVCNEHVRSGCRVVFGVGSLDADIFFVGEAPGAEEELQGEPFVGPAGRLLDRIIGAMGLQRKDVYIGNIMNWRPETSSMSGNRPPTPEEMAFCLPYLRAQVDVVAPKVLVALGATAVAGLIGPDPNRRMGRVRGTWETFAGTPVMITYHPSYVLRNGSDRVKRTVWEDMLKVMERVGYPVSDKQRNYFRK